MEITRIWREDHDLIVRVLDALEAALTEASRPLRVRRDVFEPFIEFLDSFMERCHYPMEEKRLFPAVEECGIPFAGSPMAAMMHEHHLARGHLHTVAESLESAVGGDPQAVARFLENGRGLVTLLRQHADKEEHCVLGMADRVLQGAAGEAALQSFRKLQRGDDYQAAMRRCRTLADELTAAHRNRTGTP